MNARHETVAHHSRDHLTAMIHALRLRYAGGVEVDPSTGDLLREGAPVTLRPQTAQLLHLLFRHRSRVVTREEIRSFLWGDDIGNHDEGINACVRELRRALGDSPIGATFIETAPKRGYRWIAVEETGRVGLTKEIVLPGRNRRSTARLIGVAVSAAVVLALALALGARVAVRDGDGLLIVVRLGGVAPRSASDSLVRTLSARLDSIGSRLSVEVASATSVVDIGRAELHRAGERRTVTYVLELPPQKRGESVYLYRAADRATLWTAAAESPSLVDSIARVLTAMK